MVGTWRSLVAHLNGVQGVASSNLAVPTSTPVPIISVSLPQNIFVISTVAVLLLWI